MKTKTVVLGIAAVLILAVTGICGVAGVAYYTLCCGPVPISGSPPGVNSSSQIAASEILKVEFYESSWMTHYDKTPTTFFGNVNPQNHVLTTAITSFSSDGSASKEKKVEKTTSGKKEPTEHEKYSGALGAAAFQRLAETLVANNFLNAKGGSTSTALITKRLTIVFRGGTHQIATSNTGPDPAEVSEILRVFRDLERETKWRSAP